MSLQDNATAALGWATAREQELQAELAVAHQVRILVEAKMAELQHPKCENRRAQEREVPDVFVARQINSLSTELTGVRQVKCLAEWALAPQEG
ncbi:hypothetical protein [Micromonospora sp. LH3U1]|uniref:hypothetical protein n=1 Tax=Micromonospora sp. LH3U1 TaxID=3018339 RepID=UPI002349D44B|nr:hypothetical protein [Micromonospora sp. LH3U1]WCN80024.1 hypothetical protein PCA76_24155 [Micromonospora sp. LH3U1]